MIYEGNQANYVAFSYDQNTKDSIATATTGKLAIVEATLNNRSGSATQMALCTNMRTADWKVYNYGGTTANILQKDRTASAQAGTAVTMQVDSVNVGVIFASPVKFGRIVLSMLTANSSDPGYNISYWDTASTIKTFTAGVNVPSTYPVGVTAIIFVPPNDWGKGASATVDPNSVLSDYYCLKFVSSHATEKSAAFHGIKIGRVIAAIDEVADKDYLSVNPREDITLREGEGIAPYFAVLKSTNAGVLAYKEVKAG
jgi:hypothetical protein